MAAPVDENTHRVAYVYIANNANKNRTPQSSVLAISCKIVFAGTNFLTSPWNMFGDPMELRQQDKIRCSKLSILINFNKNFMK